MSRLGDRMETLFEWIETDVQVGQRCFEDLRTAISQLGSGFENVSRTLKGMAARHRSARKVEEEQRKFLLQEAKSSPEVLFHLRSNANKMLKENQSQSWEMKEARARLQASAIRTEAAFFSQ